MIRTDAIQKILSKNDTGETGGHQAGILIPKKEEILSFFPNLSTNEKNPRVKITFTDIHGVKWDFSFIYYNNKLFGGTRNEYRLTGMTRFIRKNRLASGDELTLHRDLNENFTIRFTRQKDVQIDEDGELVLGNSWTVVKIRI